MTIRNRKKQATKRIQIGAHIDAELYRRVKAQAAIEGRKIGEVIDDALESYITLIGIFGKEKFNE